jgi:predicted alpha/beta superfamily hydrolase
MLIPVVAALALIQAPTPQPAPIEAPATIPAKLPFAVQFDLPSRITGRTYRIYVAKPIGTAPKGGWPVIYVLDGDMAFPTVAAQDILHSISGGGGAIVVGVAYPNAMATMTLRTRDLTPSQPMAESAAVGAFDKPKPEDFGGADDFYRFLTEELRPLIASSNPTDPHDQTLMGYSLGGLFTLHVLFHHPGAYRTFVASSPSIWWNGREVLKSEAAFSDAVRSGKTTPRVLITSDGWEQDPPDASLPAAGPQRDAAVKAIAAARMVDNARDLAARLKALPGGKGYVVRYVLFPEETHETGIPAASSRGFTFAVSP